MDGVGCAAVLLPTTMRIALLLLTAAMLSGCASPALLYAPSQHVAPTLDDSTRLETGFTASTAAFSTDVAVWLMGGAYVFGSGSIPGPFKRYGLAGGSGGAGYTLPVSSAVTVSASGGYGAYRIKGEGAYADDVSCQFVDCTVTTTEYAYRGTASGPFAQIAARIRDAERGYSVLSLRVLDQRFGDLTYSSDEGLLPAGLRDRLHGTFVEVGVSVHTLPNPNVGSVLSATLGYNARDQRWPHLGHGLITIAAGLRFRTLGR